MQANKSRDTRPELALRSALHAKGLRFRKHYKPLPGVRIDVDIAFTRLRVAVFLDGCFWHGCPTHATRPATNVDWWATKLDRNVGRDETTTRLLQASGWTVVRIWEHETVPDAVALVEQAVARARELPAAH